MKTLTRALPPGTVENPRLRYVIIGARYRNEWIFVRHRDRESWELPAGHIEAGEDPDQAARRELYEETGALNAELSVISDYEVSAGESQAYGRLYYAEIREIGPLPEYEIEEIKCFSGLPGLLTYPEVQRVLFSLLTLG